MSLPVAKTLSRTYVVHNAALDAARPPPPGHRAWRKRPPLGLGDWVEGWAKPVARWIDRRTAALGRPTKLAGCTACTIRRAWLNALHPDLRSLAAWLAAPKRGWRLVRARWNRP